MSAQHYMEHGKSSPDAKILSDHKICVIKHTDSYTQQLRPEAERFKPMTEAELEDAKQKQKWLIDDPKEIRRMLEPFAVDSEDIP